LTSGNRADPGQQSPDWESPGQESPDWESPGQKSPDWLGEDENHTFDNQPMNVDNCLL